MEGRIRVPDLIRMKHQRGEKIVMLTAYDYVFAGILDRAGVHIILVGDSLGTVVQGRETTLPVTLEQMIYHTEMVSRAATKSLVVADMPFLSYQASIENAVQSAGRLIKEGNACAVKLEGGKAVSKEIARLVSIGIPVMGHVGLTPQSVHKFGGYRVQGRSEIRAQEIIEDAKAIEDAGAFALVVEGVPERLGEEITNLVQIPTIGIGAGRFCNGQVLVTHDLLGLTSVNSLENGNQAKRPKFVKEYAKLTDAINLAVRQFIDDVQSNTFPDETHVYEVKTPMKVARLSGMS